MSTAARVALAALIAALLVSSVSADGKRPPKVVKWNQPIDALSLPHVILPGILPTGPILARRNESFFSQPLAFRATARFPDEAGPVVGSNGHFSLEAGFLVSVDWRRIDPPFEVGVARQGRLIGEVFCGWGHLKGWRRLYCFRDENRDGEFESVADASRMIGTRGPELLNFAPIPSLPYMRSGPEGSRGTPKQALSILTTTAGPGQLRVLLSLDLDPVLSSGRPGVRQDEVITGADLPASFRLYGAAIRVLAFNETTASIEVTEGLTTGPFELVHNAPGELRQGYSLRALGGGPE